MPLVNLHTHTNYSDGTLPPGELAKEASLRKIAFFSLTDHDNVHAWTEIEEKLKENNIRYCYGVEISTNFHDNLHILGYGVDIKNPGFLENLRHLKQRRINRLEKIVELLNKEGISLSMDEFEFQESHSYGRPHAADILVRKNLFRTRKEAYEKYLMSGKSCHAPSQGFGIEESIKIIKDAGGISVLAHPGSVKNMLDIPLWKEMGLDGIEAYYPTHSNSDTHEFVETARRHSLVITAGSDFHGPKSSRYKDAMSGYELEKTDLKNLEKLFIC
ncbi:MAG: PHP domain-containing protein [Elusimicrobia bacterium]|nr:PHP domain-containing protein [Elusimicrobiota bacterium]